MTDLPAKRSDPALPTILEFQQPSTTVINAPIPHSARGTILAGRAEKTHENPSQQAAASAHRTGYPSKAGDFPRPVKRLRINSILTLFCVEG